MNRKLRIFFAVGVLGSGGAERAAANLASELARRGHEVTIGVLRTGGNYTDTLHPAVKLHHLKGGRILGEARAIARYVKAQQPDLVFSPLYETDALVLLSRKLFGWRAKVAICCQNSVFQFAAHQVAAAKVLIRLEQLLARRGADHWFAISSGVADEAAAFFRVPREAITVIPNPVVDTGQSPPQPRDLKALFGPGIDKVLIASGRLHKQKDYPTLLKALAIVRARRLDVGLVILGQGALQTQLEAQSQAAGIADAVRFAGFQDDPLNWVAGADLFVLSSLWEGLANVLVEALWCGVPIVATDCPHGPAEVLENGRYGRLVPPADAQALAEVILQALDAPHDPKPGRRRAMDFEIGAIANRYEAAFERLFAAAA